MSDALDRIAQAIEALRPAATSTEVSATPNADFIARIERRILADRRSADLITRALEVRP